MDYISKHNVIGRGLIYVINPDEYNIKFKIGDHVVFDSKKFMITAIEMHRDLLFGNRIGNIGLVVREIK